MAELLRVNVEIGGIWIDKWTPLIPHGRRSVSTSTRSEPKSAWRREKIALSSIFHVAEAFHVLFIEIPS
jgi:hypothetical protein